MAERFRPERIILFGSYAYGAPNADSDVDILVVMPAPNELDQAVSIDAACEPYFPLDLIVRTPKNMHWRLEEGDSFLRKIAARGNVLYEKADQGVGAMSESQQPQWTPWHDITKAESSSGPFAHKSGIYQIRVVEITSVNPIPIPRFGGVDYSGTLYIGYSRGSIARRIKIFRTIHRPYSLASRMLPSHDLQARAMLLQASESYVEEQREIVRYGERFGEGPPCNRNAAR